MTLGPNVENPFYIMQSAVKVLQIQLSEHSGNTINLVYPKKLNAFHIR